MCRHKYKLTGLAFMGIVLAFDCEYCHHTKYVGRAAFYQSMVGRKWHRPQ